MAVKHKHAIAHKSDPHFLQRVDDDELHALRENERCGCPLCVTSDPWAEVKQAGAVRLDCFEGENDPRRYDDVIGEGLIAADQEDFRFFDDLPFDHQVNVRVDEWSEVIFISGCSWESIQKLQEEFRIFAEGIWKVGVEIYELMFPVNMEGELKKLGFIQ